MFDIIICVKLFYNVKVDFEREKNIKKNKEITIPYLGKIHRRTRSDVEQMKLQALNIIQLERVFFLLLIGVP